MTRNLVLGGLTVLFLVWFDRRTYVPGRFPWQALLLTIGVGGLYAVTR